MSSIYFDHHLPLADAGSARSVAWNKSEDTPLLAITEGNKVRVFREEGEELLDAQITRPVACTCLAWHPHAKVLAAGWEDGTVTLASLLGGAAAGHREDRDMHRDHAVLSITFNPHGTRCITTDGNGVVGVWKTDTDGKLSQICHYKKAGAHDKVVFRTMAPSGEADLENPPFFFGGKSGTIYLADDLGLCSERYKIQSPLMLLEYYHQKDMVVLITESVILAQFSLDAEGKVCGETKLKLSCGPHPEKLQGVWAGEGLLATTSHESIVRLWNLADDESYILSLQGIDERNSLMGDKVTSLDYNPRKRVLCTGTRAGRIVQWRCSTLSSVPKSENNWQVLPVVKAAREEAAIDRVTCGPGENLMHVRTTSSSIILMEAQLNSAVFPPFLAMQTAPMQVLLHHLQRETRLVINASFRVKGLSLGKSYVLMWNSKQVAVYEIEGNGMSTSPHSTFKRETPTFAAALLLLAGEYSVALASGTVIDFTNLNGVSKNRISCSEEVEGIPTSLDVNGSFLVYSTTNNMIRVWNITRGKPESMNATRKFEGIEDASLGEIRSVRINSDGKRVSLLVDQRRAPEGFPGGKQTLKIPDARLFVYDLESDTFLTYSVGRNCVPAAHYWDIGDPRLMACEVMPQALSFGGEADGDDQPGGLMPQTPTRLLDPNLPGFSTNVEEEPAHSVVTLFVKGENILLQDTIACNDAETGAPRMPVALSVPHVYFARQLGEAHSATDVGGDVGTVISKAVLRDFAGLEHVDARTKAALLDFSFHLACGNTDEAYKAVKDVHSTGIWESMSKMCVKTGRLDVAQKCLGQMSHARAAGALRACAEPEPEARLAVVAVHLDMVEDAETLLKKCSRYDLLNQLYQACGEWDKALEIAKTKDRVHLKPTHFAYAQHLEAVEDVTGALSHFEMSGTYRTESPRLLCSLGMTDDLEAYVEQSDDVHLHRWYAQYLESKANLEGASREYKKAGDWLSLCRVACFNKDLERAKRICEDSNDAAACYHLARHLEADGDVKGAIRFFQLAGRTSHALRLAQENNIDGDLMSLALSSDPTNMASAAKYYEQHGQPSKAVVLYQKAGCQKKALELCFSAGLFDALRKIADDLNADSDQEILAKCAGFFMQHKQHEKAVHLLSISHQYEKAVDLCVEHDVQITDDMAERMTPDKNSMDPAKRAEILQTMAKLCRKQGSFQLACKKFTQAGDKKKAMQSLLKSGDTEKIVFFAGTARQPEIYVLAGNYLQSLDWHNDSEIMKNIIQFYSKAKAYDKLAAFYDACAQVEIDEYRDYEKARDALREALKFLQKAAGAEMADSDPKVVALKNRIDLVDKFAGLRKLPKNDPENIMVQVCEDMLQVPEVETAVRVGDIYAQLVEHYAELHDYPTAHRTVERMRGSGIILTPYLDHALLVTIYNAVGQSIPESEPAAAAPAAAPAHEDDGVHEEIEEEEDA